MFTGIVEAVGCVRRLDRVGRGGHLEIAVEQWWGRRTLDRGSSVAVNGCCLTLVEAGDGWFGADLSPETIERTSFGELAAGAAVNLERPLAVGAELGGHFVLGHVDGVGRIERLDREGGNGWLAVRIPAELDRYATAKGSFAVDGISLTVARSGRGLAEFAVIPYTLAHTNLGGKRGGEAVNLECDVLARYLARLLEGGAETPPSRLTLERLIDEGF